MLVLGFYQRRKNRRRTKQISKFSIIQPNKRDIFLNLSHSSGFSLGLEEGENITFSDWSFDVSENVSVGFVAKLNSDLDTLTLGAGSAEHFGDFGVSWEVSFWVHIVDVWLFCLFSKKIYYYKMTNSRDTSGVFELYFSYVSLFYIFTLFDTFWHVMKFLFIFHLFKMLF